MIWGLAERAGGCHVLAEGEWAVWRVPADMHVVTGFGGRVHSGVDGWVGSLLGWHQLGLFVRLLCLAMAAVGAHSC